MLVTIRRQSLWALFALAVAPSAFAVPIIDTTGAIFGGLSPFGEPDTATYGQTFTVAGPETQLDNFSFRFDDALNPDFVDFAAYVYAWDGSKATGPARYASAGISSTDNGGADGYELFTFLTGGIQLTAGSQYVAFVSASNFFDGSMGLANWEISDADAYAGGGAVWANSGGDFASLTTSAWDETTMIRDLWFRASFSTPTPARVPEPGALTLLLTGLVVLSLRRRRS